MAIELTDFPEGSFAKTFLEAYVRADSSNRRLLADDFEILRGKFGWDKKLKRWRERRA